MGKDRCHWSDMAKREGQASTSIQAVNWVAKAVKARGKDGWRLQRDGEILLRGVCQVIQQWARNETETAHHLREVLPWMHHRPQRPLSL